MATTGTSTSPSTASTRGSSKHAATQGPKLLLVEDDQTLSLALTTWLRREGYDVTPVHRGYDAISRLQRGAYDLMLLDISLPDCSGWDILRSLEWRGAMPATLAFTGQAEIEGAVKALKLGAIDYIPKPASPAELSRRLQRALVSSALGSGATTSPTGHRARPPVAESDAMAAVMSKATRAARSASASVLLLGESGVGKEVVAEYIHQHSPRAAGPFVRINLAAMPATMIEAELFGSVRGAFTGAQRERMGLLAAAEGGTVLLDELCEFDIALQAKLLRVLEARRYFPVGGDQERHLDARIIAATNRDPEKAVAEGRLRADLYFRLSTVCIDVAPLRARRADIAPLAERFLRRFATEMDRPELRFSPAALAYLERHPWPGNVRQLRNAMEHAAVMAEDDVLQVHDFGLGPQHRPVDPHSAPPTDPQGRGPQDPHTTQRTSHDGPSPRVASASSSDSSGGGDSGQEQLDSDSLRICLPEDDDLQAAREAAVTLVERATISRAIRRADGNLTQAASLLGISRSTLWARLRRYNLT